MTQETHIATATAPLNADYGVLDTAFLLQELMAKKWVIVRTSLTLALLALVFTLKPHYPQVKATLRVDPPAGRTLSLGNLYNVDTEIGSIKSHGMVLEALKRAQYYALVTPITVKEAASKDRPEDDKPGAIHFDKLYFPKAMEGRQWIIEILAPDRYALRTKDGQNIAEASVGELITGTAKTQTGTSQMGRYRIQVSAIEAKEGSRFSVRPMQAEALAGLILSKLDVSKRNAGPGSNLLDIELSLADVTLAYHLVQYMTQHYILQSIDRQSAAQQQAIAKLQSSLKTLKQDVDRGKQALLDFYSKTQAADPDLELRNLIPKRSELQSKLQQAQIKRAQLELIYTPRHPALKAVIEEIALLQGRLEEVSIAIAQLPMQQSNLDQIKRELAISSDLYQSAIKELARVQLETDSLPQTVHLIDAPRVSAPGRSKYIIQLLIFGGMLGFIVGLAFVLLSASVRLGRLQTLSQLMRLTRLPVNQTIFALRRGAIDDTARKHIRELANYGLHAHEAQQIIGICAPTHDSDTARLTLELASALGRDKAVLLIDAHFYHSPLADMIKSTPAHPGLAELLTGRAALTQTLQPSGLSNVSYLACGKELANYDLLADGEALFATLRESGFAAIFILLPPASALPQPHAFLNRFTRLLHWIKTGQTLEDIQRHLLNYEGMDDPLHSLYVYACEKSSGRRWRRRKPDRRRTGGSLKPASYTKHSPPRKGKRNTKTLGASAPAPSYRNAAKKPKQPKRVFTD